MRSLVLLTVVVHLAVGGVVPIAMSPKEQACYVVIKPNDTEMMMKTHVETCVGKLSDVKTVLEGLKVPGVNLTHHMTAAALVAALGVINVDLCLEKEGFTVEATKLRECVMEACGMTIMDATGTKKLDVTAYKKMISTKAAGNSLEAAIQKGLQSCPTSGLANFMILEYNQCIMDFCTGAVTAAKTKAATKA